MFKLTYMLINRSDGTEEEIAQISPSGDVWAELWVEDDPTITSVVVTFVREKDDA